MSTMHVTACTRALVAVVATAVAAACARPRLGVEGPVLLVAVHNDVAPPSSVAVWIIPSQGPRRMLGTVAPSADRLLQTGVGDCASEYRLLAERAEREDVTSRPFRVRGDAVVAWDLASGAVSVLGAPGAAVADSSARGSSSGDAPRAASRNCLRDSTVAARD